MPEQKAQITNLVDNPIQKDGKHSPADCTKSMYSLAAVNPVALAVFKKISNLEDLFLKHFAIKFRKISNSHWKIICSQCEKQIDAYPENGCGYLTWKCKCKIEQVYGRDFISLISFLKDISNAAVIRSIEEYEENQKKRLEKQQVKNVKPVVNAQTLSIHKLNKG